MATATDETINRSFLGSLMSFGSELLNPTLYKQKQGRIVRQLTCLAVWLACWLGGWQLYEFLGVGVNSNTASQNGGFGPISRYLLPLGFVALGMWFGYRLVNWPRFADFLISVEAEMTKVSWPTKTELYRASMVVIFTMAFLAILLFCYDAFWQALFDFLKVN
jgi:preprotein translocase subunit SecE